MQVRHPFKQSDPLTDRVSSFVQGMRDRADMMPPGLERDKLLAKIQKAERAAEIEGWANSRGS